MGIARTIREGLSHNPLAWPLALSVTAFAIAEFGNYERGRDLTRVCELTGPHDVISLHPKTDREEIDSICAARLAEP